MGRLLPSGIINGRKGVVTFGLSIGYFVGHPDQIVDTVIQDIGIFHVVREKTDFHFHANELLWGIIINAVNGDAGIVVYLAHDPVLKALFQPFFGFGEPDMFFCAQKAVKWSFPNGRVDGGIMSTYVSVQRLIEFSNGGKLSCIKPIKPAVLKGLKFRSTFPLLAPSLTGVWSSSVPTEPQMRVSWSLE